jgi:hypothetical protein
VDGAPAPPGGEPPHGRAGRGRGQARYDDYGFVALDVTPAAAGQRTTMVLRFINEQGRELDRMVFSRIAGAGLIG